MDRRVVSEDQERPKTDQGYVEQAKPPIPPDRLSMIASKRENERRGEYVEAEAIYRADLGLDGKLPRPSQHPKNVWALHGLHECLKIKKDSVELPHVTLLLDQAVARADIKISSSCLCRGEQNVVNA